MTKSMLRSVAAAVGRHSWPTAAPHLWVLMYHRVLPADDSRARREEPGMMVTPGTFRRHVSWLREHFEVVRLSDWAARAARGDALPSRACAITFDDGWRDNHEFAWPVLAETGTPATVFAVSHMIGTERVFWPNRMARLLSRPDSGVATALAEWLPQTPPLPSDRPPTTEELSAIIAFCKRLDDAEIERALDQVEAGVHGTEAGHAELMDWGQLREMLDSDLVDVGSHTCHHRRLGSGTPADVLQSEIVESKERLEASLGRPVSLFCYPNGDTSSGAEQLVRTHYTAAVTTRRGINSAATPLHQLSRIGVHEDISATRAGFLARLSGWM